MRLERHKNFLSPEECLALNAWVDEGVENKWLDAGVSRTDDGYCRYDKRVTSRMYGDRFTYPQIVLDISDRIRNFCGVASYELIEGHGKNGVVVSCTFSGGDVYLHQDPPTKNGLSALRCNVMTRAADGGGQLYVDNKHIDIEVGELHCYLASDFQHCVTEVQGSTSRVLWMFGAAVSYENWENGDIKLGVC